MNTFWYTYYNRLYAFGNHCYFYVFVACATQVTSEEVIMIVEIGNFFAEKSLIKSSSLVNEVK